MKRKRKKIKCLALILAVVVISYAICAILPPKHIYKQSNVLIKDGDNLPALIAHRGGDGEFPGNTLEAYYNAYNVDNNVIMETDVNITKDGVLILLHNEQLDRTTNVTGLASDWNYTDLLEQRVDFGYKNPTEDGWLSGELEHYSVDGVNKYPTDVTYPEGVSARDEEIFLVTTLDELITAFPNNRMIVEIKQDGELGMKAVKEAVRLLEKHDAFDRIVLASFHSDVYNEYKRMQKSEEVPDNFMYSPGLMGIAKYFVLYKLGINSLFSDGVAVLQIPMEEYGFNFAEKSLIESAHGHNVAVQYWTVNDEDDMRLLIELGADGIMTDYPSKLKKVYVENND